MMPHYGFTPAGKLHDASTYYTSIAAVEELELQRPKIG